MSARAPALVPELDVSDLPISLSFYVDYVGFSVAYARDTDKFAYLVRGDVHLMLEEAEGPGRRFRTALLERPFGRGVNFQIRIEGVVELYQKVLLSGRPLIVPLEERWYRRNQSEVGHHQFVVSDPDGYILRFFEDLGSRPAMYE